MNLRHSVQGRRLRQAFLVRRVPYGVSFLRANVVRRLSFANSGVRYAFRGGASLLWV